MSRWYKTCINVMPDKRTLIGNSKMGWLVREINPELEVLVLHGHLKEVSLIVNTPQFAGYYHYKPKIGNEIWIPLLPGYSIFFQIILNENYYLKFQWCNYEINSDFSLPRDIDFNFCLFKSKFEKLSANSLCSFPYFLGFLEAENVAMLQAVVANLKRKSERSSIISNNILGSTEIPIKEGLLFEKHSKALSLEDTQTLILEYKKSQTKIYGLNQKISDLQKHIEELENKLDEKMTILDESNLLETSIDSTIKSAKLGSTILVSIEKYLSLVLIQPCPKCNNNSLINKSWNIIPIGFQVKSTIESAAGLAGGISCNAIQTSANLSIKEALQKYIKHTLLQGKKSLSVGFDCSWSYVRNANQASGEIIYQEISSDYFHKLIIAFHVVEKARLVKDEGVVKTIHQGNFDKSSRQMEHAILIEILNQISLSLEKADLHLDICIDGNLDSNKTLANIPIVSNIYANLKHLTRNIRNSLQNHIMCWFRGCIYSSALRHAAHDSHAPTEEEIHIMQVEGLIYHLQNNHTQCWSDICWTKDDPEIILQEPTLCYSSNN
ncbi:14459_t:CDS:2 [Gigaspora margarita]|uniref:14459_t:CDS:1 n=1 Tax=Gigaspora margarita TaxID=4874 RepID=A0ABM8VXP6_GIGMA|nr:14459_t:CDS:2 [Gigaspora margarita]